MLHILLLLVKGGDELVTLSTADNIITVTGNRYNKTGSTNIIITASKLGYQDNIITIPLQVLESIYKFTCLNCGWSLGVFDIKDINGKDWPAQTTKYNNINNYGVVDYLCENCGQLLHTRNEPSNTLRIVTKPYTIAYYSVGWSYYMRYVYYTNNFKENF